MIQKQEIANLAVVTANQTSKGGSLSTGLLAKNIIVSRGRALSGNGERYLVRIKKRVYPGRSDRGEAHTVQTAQLLEYGRLNQPAEPWIRPAVNAAGAEAIATFERELRADLDRIVAKLSRTI